MRRLELPLVDVHSQGHHRAANVEVVGEHEDGGDGDLYICIIYNANAWRRLFVTKNQHFHMDVSFSAIFALSSNSLGYSGRGPALVK